MAMIKMYCVKCKQPREIDEEKLTKQQAAKTGRNMLRGACPTCGTTVVKFVK